MPTYRTSQAEKTLQFDSAAPFKFTTQASVGNNVALATVADILSIPYDCKIMHVSVAYAGTKTGTVQFQIVTGTGSGAGATVGTIDKPAPANTILFATAPTITAAAGITQTFYPDVPDCAYQCGNAYTTPAIAPSCLTLRFISSNGGGDGISSLVSVTLGLKAINAHAKATYDPTPLGNYSFDPSVF